MAKIYYTLILKGELTIEEVPTKYLNDVKQLMEGGETK